MFVWEKIVRILELSYVFDTQTSRAEQQAIQAGGKVFRYFGTQWTLDEL